HPRSPLFPYTTLFRSTVAPCSRWARVTIGGKWMFETVGFAPHTTISCECSTSNGSAENMSPNTTWYAAPCVAAHTVCRTRLAPRSEEHTSELQSRGHL